MATDTMDDPGAIASRLASMGHGEQIIASTLALHALTILVRDIFGKELAGHFQLNTLQAIDGLLKSAGIDALAAAVNRLSEGPPVPIGEFDDMASKYRHRKPTKEEFRALMEAAGMNLNDFAAVTGRHAEDVLAFLRDDEPTKQQGASRSPYVPRIGDILLLELAARDPDLADTMIDIANGYALTDTG